MKMTQTLFLPSKSSQVSQGSRKLRGKVEANVNAALGACERCQESPEKRVIFLRGIREGCLEEVASRFPRREARK